MEEHNFKKLIEDCIRDGGGCKREGSITYWCEKHTDLAIGRPLERDVEN